MKRGTKWAEKQENKESKGCGQGCEKNAAWQAGEEYTMLKGEDYSGRKRLEGEIWREKGGQGEGDG